jgi:hypothetical protein
MKTLDKIIIVLDGKYPRNVRGSICVLDYVCTRAEFQQRARELGFINGYRWGFEYEAFGKKPDLPDDVEVEITEHDGFEIRHECAGIRFGCVAKFKITDPRYKPADTSYLDKPVEQQPESMLVLSAKQITAFNDCSIEKAEDWYDYENQKALRLPPAGIECEYEDSLESKSYSKCTILAVLNDAFAFSRPDCKNTIFTGTLRTHVIRPLGWNRKAEIEKARVVDAAIAAYDKAREDKMVIESFAELYDKGYLRMPPETN